MPDPPLWDDSYDGPRWTYGLTNRPLGIAHVPKGWILKSDRAHPRFRHGTVQYPRQLRRNELEGFELTAVATPDGKIRCPALLAANHDPKTCTDPRCGEEND